MDIRLNAKLSAYGKLPSPKACNVDTVTEEDIDSLFDSTVQTPVINNTMNTQTVSNSEIDLLFNKR